MYESVQSKYCYLGTDVLINKAGFRELNCLERFEKYVTYERLVQLELGDRMPTIQLETLIHSPIETCFDAARDIGLHTETSSKTQERAVAGRTEGLIELNETVTWEAVHFGIRQRMTVQVVTMERPYRFEDVMLQGAFAFLSHVHQFEERDGVTVMKDTLRFRSPFGILGRVFDALVLGKYMRNFLLNRNVQLKQYLERT